MDILVVQIDGIHITADLVPGAFIGHRDRHEQIAVPGRKTRAQSAAIYSFDARL
jgi:hypothetical protein